MNSTYSQESGESVESVSFNSIYRGSSGVGIDEPPGAETSGSLSFKTDDSDYAVNIMGKVAAGAAAGGAVGAMGGPGTAVLGAGLGAGVNAVAGAWTPEAKTQYIGDAGDDSAPVAPDGTPTVEPKTVTGGESLKGAGAVQGSSGYIDISKEVDEDILTVTDAPMRDMFVAPGEEEAASSNATGAVSTGAPVAGSAVTRKDSEPNEWTMSRYVPGKGIYFMAQTKEGAELFQEGLAGLSQAASMPAKVVGNVVGGVAGGVVSGAASGMDNATGFTDGVNKTIGSLSDKFAGLGSGFTGIGGQMQTMLIILAIAYVAGQALGGRKS